MQRHTLSTNVKIDGISQNRSKMYMYKYLFKFYFFFKSNFNNFFKLTNKYLKD